MHVYLNFVPLSSVGVYSQVSMHRRTARKTKAEMPKDLNCFKVNVKVLNMMFHFSELIESLWITSNIQTAIPKCSKLISNVTFTLQGHWIHLRSLLNKTKIKIMLYSSVWDSLMCVNLCRAKTIVFKFSPRIGWLCAYSSSSNTGGSRWWIITKKQAKTSNKLILLKATLFKLWNYFEPNASLNIKQINKMRICLVSGFYLLQSHIFTSLFFL